MRQDPGALAIRRASKTTIGDALAAACEEALGRPGSAAVIAADEQIPALAASLGAAGVPHAILEGAATGEVITPGAGDAG